MSVTKRKSCDVRGAGYIHVPLTLCVLVNEDPVTLPIQMTNMTAKVYMCTIILETYNIGVHRLKLASDHEA